MVIFKRKKREQEIDEIPKNRGVQFVKVIPGTKAKDVVSLSKEDNIVVLNLSEVIRLNPKTPVFIHQLKETAREMRISLKRISEGIAMMIPESYEISAREIIPTPPDPSLLELEELLGS